MHNTKKTLASAYSRNEPYSFRVRCVHNPENDAQSPQLYILPEYSMDSGSWMYGSRPTTPHSIRISRFLGRANTLARVAMAIQTTRGMINRILVCWFERARPDTNAPAYAYTMVCGRRVWISVSSSSVAHRRLFKGNTSAWMLYRHTIGEKA